MGSVVSVCDSTESGTDVPKEESVVAEEVPVEEAAEEEAPEEVDETPQPKDYGKNPEV